MFAYSNLSLVAQRRLVNQQTSIQQLAQRINSDLSYLEELLRESVMEVTIGSHLKYRLLVQKMSSILQEDRRLNTFWRGKLETRVARERFVYGDAAVANIVILLLFIR
jgi:hypothetical protein